MQYERYGLVVEEHVLGDLFGEITRLGGVIKAVDCAGDRGKEVSFDLPASAGDEFKAFLISVGDIPRDDVICSFCGKRNSETRRMLAAPRGGVYVCDGRVRSATKWILDNDDRE